MVRGRALEGAGACIRWLGTRPDVGAWRFFDSSADMADDGDPKMTAWLCVHCRRSGAEIILTDVISE